MAAKICGLLLILLIAISAPVSRAEPEVEDANLDLLKSKYSLEKPLVTEIYQKYGYSILPLEKQYGRAVFSVLEKHSVDALFVLTARPEPFEVLCQKFSLEDAAWITVLLLEKDAEWQSFHEKAAHILSKDFQSKKSLGHYAPQSPMETLLQKTSLITLVEKTFEPARRKELLGKLLSLSESQRDAIKQFPLALPYLMVTGDRGALALSRQGKEFLYFISLLKTSEWPAFTERSLKDGKVFLESILFYGVPVYAYWEKNPHLLETLLSVYVQDDNGVSAFQKSLLFLHTNKEMVAKYQKNSDFSANLTSTLRTLQKMKLAGGFTMAERCLIDRNSFRLAYEYPELSRMPLRQFADYEASLGDLLYDGVLRDHIALILDAMNTPGHAPILFRGLMKYYQNEKFREIVALFGKRGMMVAIHQDPNKFWKELLSEGNGYLQRYEILPNGTIRFLHGSDKLAWEGYTKHLPFPVPINLIKFSQRIWKGYYLDTYDYLLAGMDAVVVTLSLIEFFSTGQEGPSETFGEWLREVSILVLRKLSESKQLQAYLKEIQETKKASYAIRVFEQSLNSWVFQQNEKNTLSQQRKHIEQFLKIHSSANATNMLYFREVPASIEKYTFADYKKDIEQKCPSQALLQLTRYMLHNVADTPFQTAAQK